MPKEIIRTLGQLNASTGQPMLIYSVPEGHSAVISSIMVSNINPGNAKINVGVKKRGVTKSQGINTSTASNKLIDSRAKFTETVLGGDSVQNMRTGGFSTINAVDSDTQLDLFSDIFTTDGEDYIVWVNSGINLNEYIIFDKTVTPADGLSIKEGISLSEFDQLLIETDTNNVIANCFGVEITAS